MIDTSPKQEKRFVGVVKLDPAEERPGIVRLGPPPGNLELLVGGGLAELLRFPPRKVARDSKITPTPAPDPDIVALAFAREMAWRWFSGYEPFEFQGTIKEQEAIRKRRAALRYSDVEKLFVQQTFDLIPGMTFSVRDSSLGMVSSVKTPPIDATRDCSCPPNTPRCTVGGLQCQAG